MDQNKSDSEHMLLLTPFIPERRMTTVKKRKIFLIFFASRNVLMKEIPIFALPGTMKLASLELTFENNCYKTIHTMSKQKINIHNKCNTINSFQLEIADIIILYGNTKISQGSILESNKTVGIQVSIGYDGYDNVNKYRDIDS